MSDFAIALQLKKENKKELRFFYLLRDDIFVSKDRTKFFDYIIPVVPVVDSSNSYDQFISHFKKSGLFEKFDESFLQGLSLYIDDMRLLKNIYNEFVIYYYRLNTTELNCNKMLAIIAYKNLFPRDFAELQLNQGFIYTLFGKKDEFINDEVKKLENQISKIKNEIKLANDNYVTTIDELNILFARKYLRDYRHWGSYNENDLQSFINNCLSSSAKTEYSKKKEQIESLLVINTEQKEETIHYSEKEILALKNKSLHQIITRENINEIFSVTNTNEIGEVSDFNEVKSSEYFDLLKYLIRYGYIDETYADYMTYFYENSLSRIDKTFLRSITDKKSKEYSYRLKNPQLVISRLRIVDFEQEETLNFDLFEFLLLNNNESKYAKYLEAIINQIKTTRNYKFVSKFIDTNKALEQFIVNLNKQWNHFFYSVLQGNILPLAKVKQYSIDTLCYSNDEDISIINIDNCLTKYISECPDYLNIKNINTDKIISAFVKINVSFVSIDYEKSNIELFNEVYENNLYTLNFDNISIMLKHENMVKNLSDIVHKNYTVVQSREDYPLKKYITKNLPIYIEIVLNNCDGFISDEEGVAISLLNSEELDIDKKYRYIKQLNTIINEITEVVETKLWTTILEKKILAFSTSNFVNYFIKKDIDKALIHYINEKALEIDFSSVTNIYGENVSKKLFDAVAVCNDISTEKYKKIVLDLDYYFDSFDACDISEEKIAALISINRIQMDVSGLQYIRENYKMHLYIFIRNNFEDYLSIQSANIASYEEIMQIIEWDMDNNKKIKLLSYLNTPISIIDKHYDDEINAHIVNHNLNSEDNTHLFSNYSRYQEMTQTAIISLAEDRVREIINNEIQLDDILLSALLKAEEITCDQKISLFIIAIPSLNEDTCKIHLDELGLPELKMIFSKTGGRRNYEKNSHVTEVLEALKLNHWIYDYYDDKRNNNRYVVIKNKTRNSIKLNS